jgi:hypothetical protein
MNQQSGKSSFYLANGQSSVSQICQEEGSNHQKGPDR